MADVTGRLPVKLVDPTTDANEQGVDASGNAQVILAANTGVDIGDVDVLSIVPGVGATNLGKAEDAPHTDGDVGVMLLAVRRDADTVMAVADNDYSPLQTDVGGRLKVETQGGGGGTAEVDSAVFTPATTSYTPIGGIFDDATPADLTENDGGAVRMSAVREMYMNIRDGAGGERSANVTASNELNVIASAQPGVDIGDVDVLSLPTIVTLADEVDNAAVSVGGGLLMGGLVFDDTTPVVVTEGDAGYQRMSADREAYVVSRDAAGNERGANVTASNELNVIATAQPGVDIGDVDVLSGPSGASAFEVQGTAADGAAAVGNPVLMAGEEAGGNAQSLLVDANGHLQVDVLTGGGSDTPTNPTILTGASLTNVGQAAAAEFDFDTADTGAGTIKLTAVDFGATVALKAQIMSVDDNVETILAYAFSKPYETVQWRAVHRDYYSRAITGGAGFDGFRVTITNLDANKAADTYCVIHHED